MLPFLKVISLELAHRHLPASYEGNEISHGMELLYAYKMLLGLFCAATLEVMPGPAGTTHYLET